MTPSPRGLGRGLNFLYKVLMTMFYQGVLRKMRTQVVEQSNQGGAPVHYELPIGSLTLHQ